MGIKGQKIEVKNINLAYNYSQITQWQKEKNKILRLKANGISFYN